MFEKFVRNKTDNEKNIIDELGDISKESLIKSQLSEFSKNYILNEAPENLSAEELNSKIEKSNKLYFNYAIRPKWTLLNFLFGKSESRPPNEVISKLKLFPFYSYYGDAITEFIKDNSLIFITRREVTGIIDETNKAIFTKLTNETSNLKIKNFFLQIFKLKYEEESEYNLESSIPFSFVKLFIDDKSFPELNDKFIAAGITDQQQEIMLKDIIKIMTDKYIKGKKVQVFAIEDTTIQADEKVNSDEIIKQADEKIIVEIHDDDVVKVKTAETETYKTKAEPKPKEEIIYSEELLNAGKNELKNIDKEKGETESKNNPVAGLFDEKQQAKILSKVYASDTDNMNESFEKLSDFTNWNEASRHLKEIFFTNNVELYDRNVIKFVNTLNEYFKIKE